VAALSSADAAERRPREGVRPSVASRGRSPRCADRWPHAPAAAVPPPSAELSAATRLRAGGAKFYSFAVTYRGANRRDGRQADVASAVRRVYTGVADFASLAHRRHTSASFATYRLRAPSGRWSASDNGVYTIVALDAMPHAAAATAGDEPAFCRQLHRPNRLSGLAAEAGVSIPANAVVAPKKKVSF